MKALYPLSANPWHKGHQYVYDTACEIFGKENVLVGIAKNSSKNTCGTDEIRWSINPCVKNTAIIDGLVANYCVKNDINFIVRGLRNGYDLEYELQMNTWNTKLAEFASEKDPDYKEFNGLKTIFVPSDRNLDHLSSSSLREIVKLNGHIPEEYMNPIVLERWKRVAINNLPIPKNTIFFGKSCIGKSSYLNSNYSYPCGFVVDVDKMFWEFVQLDEDSKIRHKNLFRDFVYRDIPAVDCFYQLINQIGPLVEWERLLNFPTVGLEWRSQDIPVIIDFPAFGVYYNLIPKTIISKFSIVKLDAYPVIREKRIKNRSKESNEDWTWKTSKLDAIYKDAPFWDQEIIL